MIYLHQGKKQFAVDVLEELIEFYPENPEAYFKLWSLLTKDSDESQEVAEKMFLC
jgi:hypothetical protein